MKAKLYGWVLGVSVLFVSGVAWSEEVRISTYYPSPYGSYTQLDAVTINSTGVINVGAGGVPTITLTAASGAITATSLAATGAVSGATVSATGAINGATVTAAGAVSGATVTATGAVTGSSLVTGGMTIRDTACGAGCLKVQSVGGEYYAGAIYS